MGCSSVDIVFPKAQVARDGIGDHTRILAVELIARGHRVRVLGAGPDLGTLGTVPYVDAWPDGRLRNTGTLRQLLASGEANTVALQMEQFSYGRLGYNPELSRLFSDLREGIPLTQRILIAHEAYPSPGRPGHTVMWAYQRRQIRRLARGADRVLVTCEWWAERLYRTNASIAVIPAFSNIPRGESDPANSRAELGVDPGELLVVVFGHLNSLRVRLIRAAVSALAIQARVDLVYVGKDVVLAGELNSSGELVIREHASEHEVSELLSAADLALSPFDGGVSGKRGSFAALMAHGVPTVTTVGAHTDQYLRTAAAVGAFELVDPTPEAFASAAMRIAFDPDWRSRMRTTILANFEYIASVRALADAVETAMEAPQHRAGRQ